MEDSIAAIETSSKFQKIHEELELWRSSVFMEKSSQPTRDSNQNHHKAGEIPSRAKNNYYELR
jgi:hypothetical protein